MLTVQIMVSKRNFGLSIKVAVLFIDTHSLSIFRKQVFQSLNASKCPCSRWNAFFYSHTKSSWNILCWTFSDTKGLLIQKASVLKSVLWCAWIKADTVLMHACTLLFPDGAIDCWRASASGELYRVDSSAMTWLWIQLKRSISLKGTIKPLSSDWLTQVLLHNCYIGFWEHLSSDAFKTHAWH